MFEQVYYGNTVKEWIISLSIIIGALILNKGIVLLNKYVIQKLTSKTKNRLDDILFKMLESPVLLGIVLASIWIASSRLNLDPAIDKFFLRSYQVLIVLNVTWFAVRFINALISEYIEPIANDPNNKRIDSNILSYNFV